MWAISWATTPCSSSRFRRARRPAVTATDAVSGLRLGADDYLTKDISLPHLLARVAALFRRTAALTEPAAGAVLERGKLRLEGKEYVLQDGDIMTVRFSV